MYQITIDIADRVVRLKALHFQTLLPFVLYKTKKLVDFEIKTSQEEIRILQSKTEKEIGEHLSDVVTESTILLRKVAESMLEYDTFLMHGAVIALNGVSFLFSAKSGTGKTTHILQWLEKVPDAYVVNGDKPLIIAGDIPKVCGTPWSGKEQIGLKTIVPLKAIVFMERGEENFIQKISFSEAFPYLLGQVHRPDDKEKMKKTLSLLSKLGQKVDFYKFIFNNYKEDCIEVAYKALVEENSENQII